MPRRRKPRSFRTASQRASIWAKKMDAEVYSKILPRVKPLAERDIEMYQRVHEDIIKLVKTSIESYGSEYARTHAYIWFAQGLWYCKQHYTKETLRKEGTALYVYWKMLGLDPQLMKEIARKMGVELYSDEEIANILGYVIPSGVVLNPSGADPENPAWLPTEGWHGLWNFETEYDIPTFARYYSSAGNYLYYALVDKGEGTAIVRNGGYMARYIENLYYPKRYAVAFRILNPSFTAEQTLLVFLEDDGTTAVAGAISSDGTYIYLKDGTGRNIATIPFTSDWLVAVIDYDSVKLSLYDVNGNLLQTIIASGISFGVVSGYAYVSANECDVEVDWIGVLTSLTQYTGGGRG